MKKNKRTVILWCLAVIIALCIIIQLIPVNKTNPPVTAEIDTTEGVMQILKTACYDCHSNETKWPWYSHIAPVSWMIADHVNEGREELNLSEWGEYSSKKTADKREEIVEEVEEGKMPLPAYLFLHPEARLNSEQKKTLFEWAGNSND